MYWVENTTYPVPVYIGVTPGKQYTLIAETDNAVSGSGDVATARGGYISWSNDINKQTPTLTDY